MNASTLTALNVMPDHFAYAYSKVARIIRPIRLFFTVAFIGFSSNCLAQDITMAIDSSTCHPTATFTNHTRDLLRVNWDFTVVIDEQRQVPWNIFIEVGPRSTNWSPIVVTGCQDGHAWRIPRESSRLRWNR